MKLHFDPGLAHQRAAIDAVVDVLRGQPRTTLAQMQRAGAAQSVVANFLSLPAAELCANLHRVQRQAGLPTTAAPSDPWGGAPLHLGVEMETGTGKTYVYLRTALTLWQRFGLRKFVVVVPSVAIREGVLATVRATEEHFAGLFGGARLAAFAYDGARLDRLRAMCRSSRVELIVMTLDAFNKAANRIRQPHEQFAGCPPIRWLQATRPVVILDEPQRMESKKSRAALDDLRPLLVLRYGATHRDARALVHRLSPREAFVRGLVKRIEVAAVGGASSDREATMVAQIEATVAHHAARQRALRPRGIKVLSLLFVERVADWTEPDGLVVSALSRSLRSHGLLGDGEPPSTCCAAYFAEQRRRGAVRAIDSRTGRSAADERAYALIMRDKERLLSLQEPVAFIVSHSALREGWDNPNVFQICTLAAAKSSIRKRQEIGRGVRLCVDQSGRRVHDPQVDVLTVVVNDSYHDYVAGLQAEDDAHCEPQARAPLPRPAAETVVARPEAAARAEPGWIELQVDRLRADAVEHAVRLRSEVDVPADAPLRPSLDRVGAVARELLRQRPPRLVAHPTIAAVLAPLLPLPDAVAVSLAARAIRSAVDAQRPPAEGELHDAGGSAQQGVDR